MKVYFIQNCLHFWHSFSIPEQLYFFPRLWITLIAISSNSLNSHYLISLVILILSLYLEIINLHQSHSYHNILLLNFLLFLLPLTAVDTLILFRFQIPHLLLKIDSLVIWNHAMDYSVISLCLSLLNLEF